MLRADENLCNHKIVFPIEAGLNDIIKLRFKSYQPETQVYFAVGRTIEEANGQLISDISEVEILKVGFPNSIFLTVVHPEGVKGDDFSFEFWYKDQNAVMEVGGTEIEQLDKTTGYSFVKF